MMHQYSYLLRDLYNQNGGFHVENLSSHSFTCNLFDILHLILSHSPLPDGFSWLLFYFANLTFSIFFSSSQTLNVGSPTKPNSWPFVLFYTSH